MGSYPTRASPYGALDMAGNVEEWINDWYSSSYYAISPAANPTGPATGMTKAVRGGGFWNSSPFIRTLDRHDDYPKYWYVFAGFRCAASIP